MSKKRLLVLAVVVIGGLFVACSMAVGSTVAALTQLRAGKWESAAQYARVAQPMVRVGDAVTFQRIPDMHVWHISLQMLEQIPALTQAAQAGQQPAADGTIFHLTPLVTPINDLANLWHQLNQHLPKTVVARRLIPRQLQTQLAQHDQALTDAARALAILSQGDHQLLLFFQNHHELRATGGFMGSYALVTLRDGTVADITVEDIYDADGQFTGFVDAPPGVKEYLSDNHGLRLPDANWFADFSTSAQAARSYFPADRRERIDVVGAVTLELGQQLLNITGPIPLPDYGVTATAENLPAILGSHRDEFFPGSIHKKQALLYLLTHVRLRVAQFSQAQWLELARAGQDALERKSLLLYSTDPTLQTLFSAHHLTGDVASPGNEVLYLVESNVGINKVNQFTSRAVSVNVSDYRVQVDLTFDHHPPVASEGGRLAYINYQRLIVPTTWQVKSVAIAGQPAERWDETSLTLAGQPLTEIGLLVPVLPGVPLRLSVEFTRTPNEKTPLRAPLLIRKQPGVPPTPYQVQLYEKTRDFILDHDTLLTP